MGVCHTYGTVGEDGTHFAEIIAPSCDARRYRFALQRPADSPTGPRAASLASSSLPWKKHFHAARASVQAGRLLQGRRAYGQTQAHMRIGNFLASLGLAASIGVGSASVAGAAPGPIPTPGCSMGAVSHMNVGPTIRQLPGEGRRIVEVIWFLTNGDIYATQTLDETPKPGKKVVTVKDELRPHGTPVQICVTKKIGRNPYFYVIATTDMTRRAAEKLQSATMTVK